MYIHVIRMQYLYTMYMSECVCCKYTLTVHCGRVWVGRCSELVTSIQLRYICMYVKLHKDLRGTVLVRTHSRYRLPLHTPTTPYTQVKYGCWTIYDRGRTRRMLPPNAAMRPILDEGTLRSFEYFGLAM